MSHELSGNSSSINRVIYITHLDLTKKNGPTAHVTGFLRSLVISNVAVTLLSPGEIPAELAADVHHIAVLRQQPRSMGEQVLFQLHVVWWLLTQRQRAGAVVYVRAGSFMVGPSAVCKYIGHMYVVEVNGLPYEEYVGQMRWVDHFRDRVQRYFFRWQVGAADLAITVTKELRETVLTDISPRIPVVVVPNGVEPERFAPTTRTEARRQLEITDDEVVIVFVGALQAWQGLFTLLAAAAEMKEQRAYDGRFTVYIIGAGPDFAPLEAQIEQLGLHRHVRMLGHVSPENVGLYLYAADKAVAPFARTTRNQKTGLSPLKIVEYLLCGLPIVTTHGYCEADVLAAVPKNFLVRVETSAHALAVALSQPTDHIQRELGRSVSEWARIHRSWLHLTQMALEHIQKQRVKGRVEV